MSMYPNISNEAPAPSAPGFNLDFDDQKSPYQPQPPYQPPPPYSGPNYPPGPQNYPPGPQNYQPQIPPQQPPTVVVEQPRTTVNTTVVMDKFPSKAINMKCFFCQQDIKTKTEPRANICTWLLCSMLCFIGCFCGCCLIPFCTSGSRDVLHYCPKCHKYLGSHERFRFR